MHYKKIAGHIQPYKMYAKRKTTINHAFAAAVAPNDTYDEIKVRQAIVELGQDPDQPLKCVYCPSPAETWDHISATVNASRFSGHGHRLGNLLPCCKPCNSRKGNQKWDVFVSTFVLSEDRERRRETIARYIALYGVIDEISPQTPDHLELDKIRLQVLHLLQCGDQVAARIRAANMQSS